tara:strand:+ start:33 stop:335 length:303 start_codon:yes stop_codon:yes gene_type:complete
MLFWTIKWGFLSLIIIFFIHYFYEYFKNKFTKPKVYNIFNENYIEEEYEDLSTNNLNLPTDNEDLSNHNEDLSNHNEDLSNDNEDMKNELNNFINQLKNN